MTLAKDQTIIKGAFYQNVRTGSTHRAFKKSGGDAMLGGGLVDELVDHYQFEQLGAETFKRDDVLHWVPSTVLLDDRGAGWIKSDRGVVPFAGSPLDQAPPPAAFVGFRDVASNTIEATVLAGGMPNPFEQRPTGAGSNSIMQDVIASVGPYVPAGCQTPMNVAHVISGLEGLEGSAHTPEIEAAIALIGALSAPPTYPHDKVLTAVAPGYHPLYEELTKALDQAQGGKGKDRHARGYPFLEQPIMTNGRQCGVGGAAMQVQKKTGEACGMVERGQIPAAIAELHGAIIYAAAAVLLLRERDQ